MSLPRTAYFCMEMAIDQSLHTYSGGLGFLAGSHMRSAGKLDLPMVGVTMLWAYGYGDQTIEHDKVKINYVKREYDFLQDTGVTVDVTIFGRNVKVRGYFLPPEKFSTVPIYLVTTDIPENSEEDRALCNKLYDGEQRTRIAQEIILGVGGYRLLKALGVPVEVLHLNEGHALPAVFDMLADHHGNLHDVRQKVVFTTHTPVAAGNESHPSQLLFDAGFFVHTPREQAAEWGGDEFSLTVAALRMSRAANGVSQLHGVVANNMWQWVDGRCPINAITNACDMDYWQDPRLKGNLSDDDLLRVKKEMKRELFDYVAQHTGKQFDPNKLTIVWARRFTGYKRSTLFFRNFERAKRLFDEGKIQMLYAGKFHPKDTVGQEQFNEVIGLSKQIEHLAILPGYELELSGLLKRGSDVWLNTPTRPLEASGTSGMSANMNGTIHASIFDGWAVEGTYDGLNGFVIGGTTDYDSDEVRNQYDYESMMDIVENRIIPTYYDRPQEWAELMRHAMLTAASYFDSSRMAIEYFNRLYQSLRI
ncbi:MAG: alpha-glucan family phosphorylase [Candidatus Melainabacteria bacterium]